MADDAIGRAIDAALQTLGAYMAAFNARDADAFDAVVAPRHVTLGPGAPVVVDRGRDMPAWTGAMTAPDWSHSTLDRARVIHAAADKVHLDTRVTRHRHGGGAIGTYDVIYVVARENGRWLMKALSSLPASISD